MALGASAVALGVAAEWSASIWAELPPWVQALVSTNEGLILGGAAAFLVATVVRRLRGRSGGN